MFCIVSVPLMVEVERPLVIGGNATLKCKSYCSPSLNLSISWTKLGHETLLFGDEIRVSIITIVTRTVVVRRTAKG